ncbi:PAS domain S-box protein [Geobacter sulfurreducens]|uniref:PAS domain-containing sensor histidine kinase n=1 Tax=Geobacter sulfurreducens TaxID=35554 RepID=UPI000DBB1A3E|nr:PAS domain S-box protein [Geobacter sulfurreducens]BBA69229.1 Phytochrome-like protein cph1 [Geobacter sulfurreducens]
MNSDRLALILETATDGFWDWDLRADRLYLSEGYRALIGYSSDETFFDRVFIEAIVHPDDRPACVPVIRDLMDGSRISATLEYRILRGDGTTVWVQARGTAVDHDDAGRPARMVGTIFDITARKRSEEQLVLMGAVVDDATDEIFWIDREGRLVYVNRAASESFGYSREELLTMTISDVDPLTPPDRWPVFWETVRFQGGFVIDSLHRTRDGRDIPKEISVRYASVSGREIVYGFARDISERKRVEKALRTSEHRLRLMVEHLPAGAAHREGDRLLVNRAVEEITGYRRHELDTIDKWFSTLYGEQAAEVRSVYEADRTAGMRVPRIMPLRRKDDTIRHLEFFGYQYESGEVWLLHDVTARRAAEEEIRRLNADLEVRVRERTADLESFCHSVSHDLRAPLRHIAGYARILQEDYRDRLDDTGRHCLARIGRAAVNMGELVDGLLSLSHISREDILRRSVSLSALARTVGRELAEREPDRQVEFVIAEGVNGSGDPRLLKVLLENLLGNAWKFTARVGQPMVEFGMEARDGQTVYFVRDNGAGFDMRYAHKLFGSFERLHGTEEFSGTGMGLAIVRRIVERHGGTVRAESEVGRGATFSFTLG